MSSRGSGGSVPFVKAQSSVIQYSDKESAPSKIKSPGAPRVESRKTNGNKKVFAVHIFLFPCGSLLFINNLALILAFFVSFIIF